MYDAENVEFKFSRLRRHLKSCISANEETLQECNGARLISKVRSIDFGRVLFQ